MNKINNGRIKILVSICRNIPFVLLTNGGGVSEEEKARQISELVGIKVIIKCNNHFRYVL